MLLRRALAVYVGPDDPLDFGALRTNVPETPIHTRALRPDSGLHSPTHSKIVVVASCGFVLLARYTALVVRVSSYLGNEKDRLVLAEDGALFD